MIENSIRVITLGLVRNENGHYLFDSMVDPKKNLVFLRPIGGGVDFGEPCKDAIDREFREEIGKEVLECSLITVFENIFEYNGKQGHEIVFLFNVILKDARIYNEEKIIVKEGSEKRMAKWYGPEELKKAVILPPQIREFI